MTLEQRIAASLGEWPTPDRVREAFLLLARHLQRHDELVTLQCCIDAYAECRRMPDDALDALEAHHDRLQQEIWDGTPIPHLAKEAEAELDAANERIEELQEGASNADVGPLDLEAIESKAHRLMVATWECDKLSYTDQWQLTSRDVPALVAEVRRLHAERDKAQAEVAEHRRHIATVMRREEALKKRVEELEDERDDAKEQATSLASLARVSKALAAKRAETIAAQQQHIEVLNRRLAERDADAEVGRAIRELRPREGHLYAEARIRPGGETPCCCRVSWRTPGRDGVRNTRFYDSLADAIKEYNERED